MSQKAKMLILVVIILIATLVVVVYFVKKNIAVAPVAQTASLVPETTVEGIIISITKKDIQINNNSSKPMLIGISPTTTVVEINKDNVETPAVLSNIMAGSNAKVLYNKNKDAEKIYLISK